MGDECIRCYISGRDYHKMLRNTSDFWLLQPRANPPNPWRKRSIACSLTNSIYKNKWGFVAENITIAFAEWF